MLRDGGFGRFKKGWDKVKLKQCLRVWDLQGRMLKATEGSRYGSVTGSE